MVNARRRAQLFAAAAGVQLGDVLRIEEGVQHEGPQPLPVYTGLRPRPYRIERGTLTLEATVSVTWALR